MIGLTLALLILVLASGFAYGVVIRRRRRAAQLAVAVALYGLINPWQRTLWWMNHGMVKFGRALGDALATSLKALSEWAEANKELLEAFADDQHGV